MTRPVPMRLLLPLAAALAACPANPDTKKPGVSTCKPCVSDEDCASERCVQMAGDAVCARVCDTDAECSPDDACADSTTAEGAGVRACLARDGACGTPPSQTDPVDPCKTWSPPETAGTCCRCSPGRTCAANGCYGQWWCDPQRCLCAAPPAACAGPPHVDALRVGGAVTTALDGRTGGKVSRLHFAVMGDTRPALVDDTAHYPVDVARGLFRAIEAAQPRPSFVVATGDFVFAKPRGNEAAAQFDKYMECRASFSGVFWPAYGNHECDGYTESNCGPGLAKGETNSYKAYVAKLLAPIGETKTWFARRVDAADGSWTAKFVFVSSNSWSPAQGTWLEEQLSQPTTYTFVVRHVPAIGTDAPGTTPSEQSIARHPVSMLLEGHAHTFLHPARTKEVIVGNGGAPLTTNTGYGFAVVSQRADGALVVTNYELATGRATYTFEMGADGSEL